MFSDDLVVKEQWLNVPEHPLKVSQQSLSEHARPYKVYPQ